MSKLVLDYTLGNKNSRHEFDLIGLKIVCVLEALTSEIARISFFKDNEQCKAPEEVKLLDFDDNELDIINQQFYLIMSHKSYILSVGADDCLVITHERKQIIERCNPL